MSPNFTDFVTFSLANHPVIVSLLFACGFYFVVQIAMLCVSVFAPGKE